jgi:hypothetical protein
MVDRQLPFALVTFPASAEADALLVDHPERLRGFYSDGVPKSFVRKRYRANDSLSVRVDRDGRHLVCFGSTFLDGAMCLDITTGEVVQLVGRTPSRLFVNSSLSTFSKSVEAVSRAFPFYPDGAEEADIESAARRVSEIISAIDGPAMVLDRFWSTLIDDLRMGDWGTGAVLDLIPSDY